jgi:hypothetical protein
VNHAPSEPNTHGRSLSSNKKKELTLEEVISEYDRILNLRGSCSSLNAVIGVEESETKEATGF